MSPVWWAAFESGIADFPTNSLQDFKLLYNASNFFPLTISWPVETLLQKVYLFNFDRQKLSHKPMTAVVSLAIIYVVPVNTQSGFMESRLIISLKDYLMFSISTKHPPVARHTWMLVCLDNVLVTEWICKRKDSYCWILCEMLKIFISQHQLMPVYSVFADSLPMIIEDMYMSLSTRWNTFSSHFYVKLFINR